MSACHWFCFASAMCLEGLSSLTKDRTQPWWRKPRILTLDHQRIPGLVLSTAFLYLLEFILNDWVLDRKAGVDLNIAGKDPVERLRLEREGNDEKLENSETGMGSELRRVGEL